MDGRWRFRDAQKVQQRCKMPAQLMPSRQVWTVQHKRRQGLQWTPPVGSSSGPSIVPGVTARMPQRGDACGRL